MEFSLLTAPWLMTPAVRNIAVGGLRNPPFWRVFCCPGEAKKTAAAIEGDAKTGPGLARRMTSSPHGVGAAGAFRAYARAIVPPHEK